MRFKRDAAKWQAEVEKIKQATFDFAKSSLVSRRLLGLPYRKQYQRWISPHSGLGNIKFRLVFYGKQLTGTLSEA